MKRHSPTIWAWFFGIHIIDCDGWKDKEDYAREIPVAEFLTKVAESTIEVVDYERYKALEFML